MAQTARQASKTQACPLCDRTKYCFLIGTDPISTVICQWTDANRPPPGWTYDGLAKDGRPKFQKEGARRRRSRKYPALIRLQPKQLSEPAPDWEPEPPPVVIDRGTLITDRDGHHGILEVKRRVRQGKRLMLECASPGSSMVFATIEEKIARGAAADPTTGDQIIKIEYLYPDPLNPDKPLGKVVRRQWSDRRPWFEAFTKNKEVRPWSWNEEQGDWVMGRGQRSWPLYRENEAKEAIMKGECLLVVAGEQAVETYRGIGIPATTCQGGEARFADIADRLSGTVALAKDAGVKPLLVIHPDFDLTGDTKFTGGLMSKCRQESIPAVGINPLALWQQLPHGGDIKDVVEGGGILPDELISRLEAAIDEAIDLNERAERDIQRRQRWGAPESWDGELGYFKATGGDEDDTVFRPLTNFDLQIEKEVASTEGGGFLLQVKRSGEPHQHRVFLPSLEFTGVANFENTLKKSIGGALICRMNTNQMKSLLRVRLAEYHSRGGKVYRLAERVGQQSDGFWIFQQNQLTPTGEATTEEQSRWIWNDGITGQADTLPLPSYNPASDRAIPELVAAMVDFYGPQNIYPGLLALGYGAAAIHYQEFIERVGSFPILNLIGDGGGGKTTAGECALSLCGMHTEKAGGMLRDVSVSAAYERLKLIGGLLHCWDDPHRTPDLDEFLKGLYNGKARLVRGGDAGKFNSQKPHSALMVASNFAAGETNAATMSRLILLWFDCKDRCAGKSEWTRLRQAMNRASGGLPQILGMGVDLEAISAKENQLLRWLPHAHSRMARSLAIIYHYTQEILGLCGEELPLRFDVYNYLKEHVCSMANDVDASTDSLRDFIERLSMLRSQAKIGEWNMRFIPAHNSDEPQWLSIRLDGVWDVVDKNSKLAYNKQIIKNLLKARGAKFQDRQRFHGNEDVSKAYERKQTDDPIWRIARCISIPIDLVKSYIEIDDYGENLSTGVNRGGKSAETPDIKQESLLTSNCQQSVHREKNCQQGDCDTEKTADSAPALLTEKSCQQSRSVDSSLSTEQTQSAQALEGDSGALLTLLTKKMPADELTPPLLEVAVGDWVIPTPSTTWYKQGSPRLSKDWIDYRLKKEANIKLYQLECDGLHNFQEPSKVLSISRDKKRVKVRNSKNGRTDVLSIEGLQAWTGEAPLGPTDNP